MNRADFLSYKISFVDSTRRILARETSESLNEAAFPAYANNNRLSSFLFWSRIRTVMEYLETGAPYNAAMDFGCGGGVMLPYLSKIADRVAAVDINLSPLKKMRPYINLPESIKLYDLREKKLSDFAPSSFDVILALDVLEHVENLTDVISELCKSLVVGGRMIVSGPTENLAYRVGRKLSGPEYSGHYHVRNIYDIKEELAKFMQVTTISTLFYPIPLFKIYCGTRVR